MKCVFTKVSIYSDTHCMSGWPAYSYSNLQTYCE